jgi:hypothetical protein
MHAATTTAAAATTNRQRWWWQWRGLRNPAQHHLLQFSPCSSRAMFTTVWSGSQERRVVRQVEGRARVQLLLARAEVELACIGCLVLDRTIVGHACFEGVRHESRRKRVGFWSAAARESAAIHAATTRTRKDNVIGVTLCVREEYCRGREVHHYTRALRSLFRLEVEVAPQESAGKHRLEGGEEIIGEHDAL